MKKKLLSFVFSFVLLFLVFTNTAFAHTRVIDSEVGVGKQYVFTLQSPNERELATTSVRLVLPSGLEDVMPDVTAGWEIEVKKDGDGEDAMATEIIWSSGEIPEGQIEQLQFRAKVPGEETTLMWKAYQTYSDGKVVSWDQDPSQEEEEGSDTGPGSETKIIDDLSEDSVVKSSTNQMTTWAAYGGLLLGLVALGIVVMMRRKSA